VSSVPDEKRPRFATDRPAAITAEDDLFGHHDYATALRAAVLDAETGTTFGLFGPWGVGKSTILNALGEQLAGDPCAYVQFDAWRYEHDAFRREFLRDLASKLGPHLPGYDIERELGDLDVDVPEPEERMTVSWRRSVAAVPALLILLVAAIVVGGVVTDAPSGVTISLAALIPVLGYLALRLEGIVNVQTVTVAKRRLEDPDRFARRFRDLLGALDAERLVIAVDNLDRCAPDAAVELLSAIKTYLEPELTQPVRSPRGGRRAPRTEHRPPEVVFVIAADADALRRHLGSKANLPGGSAAAERAARDYADDYLRKFFGVQVNLRPLLGEDVREYMGRHLDEIVDRWVRDERDREIHKELVVAMAAAGLRRNPRRVKQFANNLEMQLSVLRERELAGRLSHPLSANPSMVAKLLLLEEEWPDLFAAVQRDQSRLALLTRAALAREPSEDYPELSAADEHSRVLASFLRSASNVPDEAGIRAYLRLKLSVRELLIPGYEEFRTAVVLGAEEEIVQQLSAAGEGQNLAGYGERLAVILDEELRSGRMESAIRVIGVANGLPQFRRWVPGVVRAAVADGRVLERMAAGSAQVLAETAELLPAEDATRVLDGVAESFLAQSEPAERRSLGRVLAGALDSVAPETRAAALEGHLDRLRANLADIEFAVALPLVAVEPRLSSIDLLDSARRTVTAAEEPDDLEGLRKVFLPSDDPEHEDARAAAEVMLIEAERHEAESGGKWTESQIERLVVDFARLLSLARAEDALFKALVRYIPDLFGRLRPAPRNLGPLENVLVEPHADHPDALVLLAELPIPGREEQVRRLIAELTPDQLVAYAGRRQDLPEPLRTAVAERAAEAGVLTRVILSEAREPESLDDGA
jgi:hypothetical protein